VKVRFLPRSPLNLDRLRLLNFGELLLNWFEEVGLAWRVSEDQKPGFAE
jgi:hypothetical protein